MNMDVQEKKIEYLQHCVSENLNHARHVENERLTFTSIYVAMAIGAVAAIFAMDDQIVAAILATVLAVFGFLAMLLNMRWQGVFDDHIHAAEACQDAWRSAIGFSKKDGKTTESQEKKVEAADIQLPETDYYYTDYTKANGIRKIGRLLFGWPALKAEEKKWFFKEIGRTRHIFALVYLIIFIALVALSCYLWVAEDYGGFYFTKEVIERLEEAIGLIVEETRK